MYPFAKIVAVEPDAGNFEIAAMNLTSNARIICAGISSKIGSARLMDMGRNCAFRVSSEDPNSNKGIIIDLITIPDILLEEQVNIPFLIKIDIEGFESDLFSQGTEWIDRFPVLLIELHDWMLPGELVTNNFLKEISKRNREFMHFNGYVVSISPELINSKIR
jgi:FkbM family methyltransferase